MPFKKPMNYLQKLGWKICISVLQYLRDDLNNLPLFTYTFFAFQTFYLYNKEYYYKIYNYTDIFDLFLYIIISIDLIYQLYNNYVYEKLFKYNEANFICCIIIYAILVLQIIYYTTEIEYYLSIYKAILMGGFVGLFFTRIK